MAAQRCGVCHRRLTDPASIAMGYGPECRGKMTKRGWKFPKPIYRVTHGKVELVRLEGDLTPPAQSESRPSKKVKR
ncbi:MAG: hypothetical protein HY867_06260 [Chloroflexi bacterium]|nr:hypothetical protein [Chloroflexota bacterium]